jgi:hypothetical protein
MEGSMVNLDVTAPGATLALALMFLKACCAVAFNSSFFSFFCLFHSFCIHFGFAGMVTFKRLTVETSLESHTCELSLLANFPLSEAQMNFGQRKEGYYITSANAIMTWTCTGNFGIV